ncbi:MAG: inorganic phosphate transporter [Methylococcaceae bacterium]
MTEPSHESNPPRSGVILDTGSSRILNIVFLLVLLTGFVYTSTHLSADLSAAHTESWLPLLLLGVALLVALGFEFVNGFHDTANAVATVIYTHSLPAKFAVIWSGAFNFLGVLVSSGSVAFGVVSLLPVELILQVGNNSGFAMVFAMLIAAIIWNLGTWYLGLPSSSSHTLIGSIIGVGLMNQLLATQASATSGIDWTQAIKVGKSLVYSPLIGFGCAALLFLAAKLTIKVPELYDEPKGQQPPPLWIRGLLILTCTGVSFAHGSNDGQKGMGLIMLILIGTVPTAYALNHSVQEEQVRAVVMASDQAIAALGHYAEVSPPQEFEPSVKDFLSTKKLASDTIPSITVLARKISEDLTQYQSLAKVPDTEVIKLRNRMYLVAESLRIIEKDEKSVVTAPDKASLKAYREQLDSVTRFIPTWVKVAVAIALGLGTMVGWRRIVVTVGERIGKTHLTYAQGAAAELVAMTTIGAADMYGLPVSTTHVLSSGVAGSMAANQSGLQMATVRNLLMAWILTLPASIILSGGLFALFKTVF